MIAGRELARTMPCASAMNSCRETSVEHDRLPGRGRPGRNASGSRCHSYSRMRRVWSSDSSSRRNCSSNACALSEHLGLHARARLAAVGADGVARADPGQRDKHQRRNDDGSPAEPANAMALRRRRRRARRPGRDGSARSAPPLRSRHAPVVPPPSALELIPIRSGRGKKASGCNDRAWRGGFAGRMRIMLRRRPSNVGGVRMAESRQPTRFGRIYAPDEAWLAKAPPEADPRARSADY